MRLRLIIRRNGLPDSHILWSSAGLNSTLSSNNKKITIAEFLREIDDVIPLESEDWGLEEYVVEVGGFECVHFSALESVLKEDDEVVIRPLALNDRRFRRVSGRVQIATDGRRLYDGIAFGRPFLRKAPRPPVRIPSIKRARISYDDEREAESDTPNQLVLRDEDSSDEDESDYHEELNAEEIADLAAEAMASENAGSALVRTNPRKRRRAGLGIQAVQASPPDAPRSSSFSSRLRGHKYPSTWRETLGESPKSVRFEGEGIDTPATVLAPDDSEDSEDEDFDTTDDDSDTDDSEANKENIAPARLAQTTVASRSSQFADQSSAESEETTSDSESTSSSSDDSSDTDSTSAFDSSDESSDSEESFSQLASRLTTPDKSAEQVKDVVGAHNQLLPSESGTKQSNGTTSTQVPSGQGKLATRKRNARRKLKKQFDKALAIEASSQLRHEIDTEVVDQSQLDNSYQSPKRDAIDSLETRTATSSHSLDAAIDLQAEDSQTLFEKDKVAVDKNVDVTMTSIQETVLETSSPPQEKSSKMNQSQQQDTNDVDSVQQQQAQVLHKEPIVNSPTVTPKERQTSSRRTKLDLGGATRMLFSSLGLRAPKTKNEADKLRDELKAKAQELPGNMLGPVKLTTDSAVAEIKTVEENYDEFWMDRIDLQAVECCYDGVTYSKPPFPFVQRWDPQQQYHYGNAGKRSGGRNKRRKRNNQQYYQNDDVEEGYLNHDGADDQQNYQDQSVTMESEITDARIGTENIGQANSDTHAANDQLLEEMQAEVDTAQSDLPDLPADMSTLDMLTIDNALPGCIIAFKQMEMSEHTQWCPVISEYRTAKIEAVLEHDVLDVLLAARDVLHKEKNYDPETGERIYSKFEIPIDEDEEGDDRRLEIGLQDMIEPRLVKAAEVSHPEHSMPSAIEATFDKVEHVLSTDKNSITVTTKLITEVATDTDDTDLRGLKIEPITSSSLSIQKTIPTPTFSLLEAEDSQPPTRAETVLPHLRLASVELGSQNPPQRFFSEPQSGLLSDAIDVTMLSSAETDHHSYVSAAGIRPDTSITISKCDDPSIWGPSTENNDEEASSHYYSLSTDQTGGSSSSALPTATKGRTNEKDAISNVDLSEKSDYLADQTGNTGLAPSLDALQDEEIDAPPFMHDRNEESKAAETDENLADDKSEESTFLPVDSSSKDKSHIKNELATMDDDWNSDTDSSSLPSLKDLISGSAPSLLDLPQLGTKRNKKNKYPNISSTAQEDIDSFVFSQAPKRLISDTHKMAIDLEGNSFIGSSYAELPTEPYELEAHVTDTGAHELEDNEPQLPPAPTPDEQSEPTRTTRRSRFASPTFQKPPVPKSNAKDTTVVDLTLSSDTIEPDEESSQVTWSVASSMPSGSGWIGKKGGSLRTKVKHENKNSKRNLKRTKSLV